MNATFNAGTVGPINMGNPHEFTIRELADLCVELTSSSSTITHLPLPGDDPKMRKPDITRARADLGWEPQIQLRKWSLSSNRGTLQQPIRSPHSPDNHSVAHSRAHSSSQSEAPIPLTITV